VAAVSWYQMDRKHWELRIGRLVIERWCARSSCSWHGWTGPHPVRIGIEGR